MTQRSPMKSWEDAADRKIAAPTVRAFPVLLFFSLLLLLSMTAAFSSAHAFAGGPVPRLSAKEAASVDSAALRLGPLPLQAKVPVDEAEQTEDRQLGVSHFAAIVLLSLGLLLGAGWLYGSGIVLAFRKDPLPARVRSDLDRLDSVRLSVRRLAYGAMASNDETKLFEVRALYDKIAEEADALLDKAKAQFCLGAVDQAFFASEIDALIARCKALSEKLASVQPKQGAAAPAAAGGSYGSVVVARAKRGWERVFAKDAELKMTTIAQLNAMKWPLWSALKWMSGGTPPRKR